MKITVHGSAASAPTPARGMPAISVSINGEVLLLDCGEGTQRQMMKHGVSYAKVKAILISHLHLDHFLGVFGLLETLRLSGRQEPLHLFGPKGSSSVFGNNAILRIHELDSMPENSPTKKIFDLEGHAISAFPVKHSKNRDCFGFVVEQLSYVRFHEAKAKKAGLKGPMFKEIQKNGELKIGKKTVKLQDITYLQKGKRIVYTGDTEYCEGVVFASTSADLLIHESTFCEDKKDEAKEKNHSTAKEAAQAAKKAKASHLLLTHISGRYSDGKPLLDEASAVFKGKITVAKDGLQIEI